MRGIIFHEFTHVLIAELTGGNIPTWLNEGLATYYTVFGHEILSPYWWKILLKEWKAAKQYFFLNKELCVTAPEKKCMSLE